MTSSCSISCGIYKIPWMTAKLVKKTFHGCCSVGLALFQWPGKKERSHTRVKLWPEELDGLKKGASGQTERARDKF